MPTPPLSKRPRRKLRKSLKRPAGRASSNDLAVARGPSPTARKPRPGPDQAWRIACGPEEFASLRENAAFHRLLDLARHVNQLYAAMAGLMPYLDEDSPAADRQRRSTFFLFGGTLYEAFQLVEHLRPHLGTHPAWADTFGAYGSDEDIRARLERGGDLHTIRNHVAYHTARHVAGKSLERLNLDAYVFVSGRGMRSGNMYYDLADTVATHWASGAPAPGEPFLREMERVAVLTRDLALDFARRGERLIHRTLSGFGFRMERRAGDCWETEVAPVPADAPGGPRA